MARSFPCCKDRQESGEYERPKQQCTCDGCLQLFNQEDLIKHKRKRKKECTETSFILKALYRIPKFKTLIDNNASQKLNLEDFMYISQSPDICVSSLGVSGKLVSDIGRIFVNINTDTTFHCINDKPVNKEIIYVLLSGVKYHPTDVNNEFLLV